MLAAPRRRVAQPQLSRAAAGCRRAALRPQSVASHQPTTLAAPRRHHLIYVRIDCCCCARHPARSASLWPLAPACKTQNAARILQNREAPNSLGAPKGCKAPAGGPRFTAGPPASFSGVDPAQEAQRKVVMYTARRRPGAGPPWGWQLRPAVRSFVRPAHNPSHTLSPPFDNQKTEARCARSRAAPRPAAWPAHRGTPATAICIVSVV